jgi:cell division protein FtsB
MEITHAYMCMLYGQLAQQHAEMAKLQDEVLRLNQQNITLKADLVRNNPSSGGTIETREET